MNDLIKREAVIEMLKELCETKDTIAYGLQLVGNYEEMRSKLVERDCVKSIIEEIEYIPTAYDMGKVVENIKNSDSVKCFGSTNSGNLLIPVEDVVKIVKGGGVDE